MRAVGTSVLAMHYQLTACEGVSWLVGAFAAAACGRVLRDSHALRHGPLWHGCPAGMDAPLALSRPSPCFPAICCAACEQFVGLQPCAGKVIGAAYTLLQGIISLVAPGSHRRLAAAAGTASDAQQCTAVVWGLQVGPLEWAYRSGDAGCPVLSSVCALQCVGAGRFTGSFAWVAGCKRDARPTGQQANGEQA